MDNERVCVTKNLLVFSNILNMIQKLFSSWKFEFPTNETIIYELVNDYMHYRAFIFSAGKLFR